MSRLLPRITGRRPTPTVSRPIPAVNSVLIRSGAPRLRVLTYRWHVPHQYELWKLPIDVTMATGTGSAISEQWDYGQRPLPDNARFRPFADINPRDYDLAILHFDENVLAPENTQGMVGAGVGSRVQIVFASKLICRRSPSAMARRSFTANTTSTTQAQI